MLETDSDLAVRDRRHVLESRVAVRHVQILLTYREHCAVFTSASLDLMFDLEVMHAYVCRPGARYVRMK